MAKARGKAELGRVSPMVEGAMDLAVVAVGLAAVAVGEATVVADLALVVAAEGVATVAAVA